MLEEMLSKHGQSLLATARSYEFKNLNYLFQHVVEMPIRQDTRVREQLKVMAQAVCEQFKAAHLGIVAHHIDGLEDSGSAWRTYLDPNNQKISFFNF